MDKNSQIIQDQLNAFIKKNTVILNEIGNINKKAAQNSFDTKSFNGQHWADSKEQKNELLVKTGALKNSIKVNSNNIDTVHVTSNVSYAVYHNEGTDKLARRQFIGNSTQVKLDTVNFIQKTIKSIFK